MKKAIFSLVLLALTTGLQAQSEWTGLWRVNRIFKGEVESVYHLYIQVEADKLKPTIYSQSARPMTLNEVSFDSEENTLEIRGTNSEKQPLPMFFKFSFSDNQLSGEWAFAHMQLTAPVTGNISAFRVFRAAEWDPWIEVENRRASRFLNFTKMLLEKAPLDRFQDFLRFWNSDIERNYYFILNQWVYGKDLKPGVHKRRVLMELFDRLNQEGFQKGLLDLDPIAERTVRTIKLLRSTDDIGLFVVSLPGVSPDHEELVWSRVPTPQEEAECACKLDLRERFIFVDPARFSKIDKGNVLAEKVTLARSLWTEPRPPLAIQVFRHGLALAYAAEVNAVDWPAAEESVAAARIEFSNMLMEDEGMTDRALESPLATSLSYGLGLAFVRKMREKHSLNDLFSLSFQEIMKGWQSFLAVNPTGE